MRYLVEDHDDNNGNRVFDTLRECQEYFEEESRYSGTPLEDMDSRFSIFEIGASVPFNVVPATIVIGATANIPAPFTGESVTDYAARITNG